MLPELHRELLTAYVDGELSARDRRRVVRLLRRSRTARRLLRRLQRDARAVAALRAPALPTDFSDTILQAIHQRGLDPGKRRFPRVPAAKPTSAWWSVGAAAAVLLVVSLGSYLVFSGAFTRDPGQAVRPVQPNPSSAGEGPEEIPSPREIVRDDHRAPTPEQEKKPPVKVIPAPFLPHEPIVRAPAEEEEPPPDPPQPEKKPDVPVLTSGGREEQDRLERVEIALPNILRLEELEGLLPREKLASHFGKGSAFRVEILCRDASRAVDRLKPALQSRQINLSIESLAQARLKKPQFRSDYGLFVENITSADLVEVLHQAWSEDRKGASRKPPEVRLDGGTVYNPLSRWDRGELVELLGVDPTRVRPAPPAPPAGQPRTDAIDIRKPLSEGTLAQVEHALDGKGPPRPGSEKASKPEPNSALLLALGSRSRGPEIKRFLDARKPARPETLQVFLVLRNVGG